MTIPAVCQRRCFYLGLLSLFLLSFLFFVDPVSIVFLTFCNDIMAEMKFTSCRTWFYQVVNVSSSPVCEMSLNISTNTLKRSTNFLQRPEAGQHLVGCRRTLQAGWLWDVQRGNPQRSYHHHLLRDARLHRSRGTKKHDCDWVFFLLFFSFYFMFTS